MYKKYLVTRILEDFYIHNAFSRIQIPTRLVISDTLLQNEILTLSLPLQNPQKLS